MKGKILVTGGAGYIGSHFVKALIEQGYSVVVLDSLKQGHSQAVDSKAVLVIQDLADHEKLAQVFEKYAPFQAVVHFAAYLEVERSVYQPLDFYNNNVSNTLYLLQNMVAYRVKYFIFSSSAAVYGEPQYTPIDENHLTLPINPYGKTKWMVENILQDCSSAYGLRFCSLRYFNAAGAHPDGDLGEDHYPETHLIPNILKTMLAFQEKKEVEPFKIFGTNYPTPDGTCVRDFIHVCDLADAHILALEYLIKGGKSDIFNLGNGVGYSVQEVVQTAIQLTNIQLPIIKSDPRPGDPAVLVASAEKIKKILGWTPRYSLQDMIAHAWNWYLNHPSGFSTI